MTLITNLVIVTTLFTGFSGLVYEVTWQKYLANILGSQAQATALVLAVFLGGLSVGYQLFGNLSRRRSTQQLVKMTGWAEVLIGLWAFFFDSIFGLVMNTFGILDPSKSYSFVIDIAVSIIVIGFPTVLMGVTLPLLTQALSTSIKNSGPMHARIYSVNTAGAFFGCLIGGFVLLPGLGLPLTMFYLSFANLICGFVLVFVARYLPTDIPAEHGTEEKIPIGNWLRFEWLKSVFSDTSVLPINITALLAGFCALTIQTALIRLIGLTMGSSEYAFSMVVSAYILLLALGAWRISKKQVGPGSLAINQVVSLLGLALVYVSINYWPYASHLVRILFTPTIFSFYAYHAMMFIIMLAVLYIPVGAMGRTMPLLFRSSSARIDLVGKNVGSIYAWNAVGCVAGAYLGGYLLYYYFDIDVLLKICMSFIAITALLTLPAAGDRANHTVIRLRRMAPVLAVAVIAVFFMPDHLKDRFAFGLFRTVRPTPETTKGAAAMHREHLRHNDIVFYKDGPSGAVAVLEKKVRDDSSANNENSTVVKSLIVNGKSDGSTCCGDKKTFQLSAHVPAMLHNGTSGQVAVVGFGTGLSVGTFSLYDDLKHVDIYEISPTIRDIAPLFDFANGNVTTDPKVSWTIGDAFRSLGATDKKYSIILSEPSNPWVAGVERLFSQDFYKLTRNKLEKGGVYAQWFHLYSISQDTVGLVINTFASVFPHVRIFALEESDLCMIGSEEPIDDSAIERMTSRYENFPGVRNQLKELDMHTIDALLGQEYVIRPEYFRDSGIHSLDIPRLSFDAGIDFFMQQSVDFNAISKTTTAIPWFAASYANSLLMKKYTPERIASLTDAQTRQLVIDTCQVISDDINYGTIMGAGRRFCVPMFWSIIDKRGRIETVDIPERDRELFRAVSNPELLPSQLSNPDSTGFLAMIAQIGAAGIPVARETISKLLESCAEPGQGSAQCQVNGVKVSIALLDSDGAKAQLASLRNSPTGRYVMDTAYIELETAIRSVDALVKKKGY